MDITNKYWITLFAYKRLYMSTTYEFCAHCGYPVAHGNRCEYCNTYQIVFKDFKKKHFPIYINYKNIDDCIERFIFSIYLFYTLFYREIFFKNIFFKEYIFKEYP